MKPGRSAQNLPKGIGFGHYARTFAGSPSFGALALPAPARPSFAPWMGARPGSKSNRRTATGLTLKSSKLPSQGTPKTGGPRQTPHFRHVKCPTRTQCDKSLRQTRLSRTAVNLGKCLYLEVEKFKPVVLAGNWQTQKKLISGCLT